VSDEKPAEMPPKAEANGEAGAAQTSTGVAAAVAPAAGGTAAGPPKRDRSTLYWTIAVVSLVLLELYVYGRRGAFMVCVAKEGAHDWNLIGQQRNDQNRWKFPFCEERRNLGLRSEFDELAVQAVKTACHRATLMHFKTEQNSCIAMEKGWRRKVITRQIMPWEKSFYRRLFWLEKR
jgi:hypothetical protein